MTIWERVEAALAGIGIPVFGAALLESIAELPDAYIVHQLITSTASLSADNQEALRNVTMQVSYYTRDGFPPVPPIAGMMTAAGFRLGAERELPYSPTSRHFGLAMEFTTFEESI